MRARFRSLYGADPLHLLALIASLLIAGAAIAGWFQSFPGAVAAKIVAWFLAAIVAHDLVLLPLYSLLDRIAFGPRKPGPTRRPPRRPSDVNYLRIPALLSGLLFLVFFPEILRLGDQAFFVASGLHQRPFLVRYLLVCAALFALSAVAYAIKLRGASARARARPSPAGSPRRQRIRALGRLVPARRTRGGRRRGGTRRS
jgi:hypothetical protein